MMRSELFLSHLSIRGRHRGIMQGEGGGQKLSKMVLQNFLANLCKINELYNIDPSLDSSIGSNSA